MVHFALFAAGPKHAANVAVTPGCAVTGVCDRSLQAGEAFERSFEDGPRALVIADAAEASLRQQRTVTIDY